MKILINESAYQRILQEFRATEHFDERLKNRFLNEDHYDVIAVSKEDRLRVLTIGTYKIPQEVKSRVSSIIDVLKRPEYVADTNTGLVVELHEFRITSEDVEFTGNIQSSKNIFRDRNRWSIYLQETIKPNMTEKPSSGYYLVCFIYNNGLITMFLTRSKNPQVIRDRIYRNYGFSNVKVLTDIDNDLLAYIDPEIAKQTPIEPETPEIEPETPEELTKDEIKALRRQAYVEKQKKLFQQRKK